MFDYYKKYFVPAIITALFASFTLLFLIALFMTISEVINDPKSPYGIGGAIFMSPLIIVGFVFAFPVALFIGPLFLEISHKFKKPFDTAFLAISGFIIGAFVFSLFLKWLVSLNLGMHMA